MTWYVVEAYPEEGRGTLTEYEGYPAFVRESLRFTDRAQALRRAIELLEHDLSDTIDLLRSHQEELAQELARRATLAEAAEGVEEEGHGRGQTEE